MMPLQTFTPLIMAHTAVALGAVVVGAGVMYAAKGTPGHRLAGRVWMALMLLTALTSFGIRVDGHYSWIHLLSITTLIAVYGAIRYARQGNIVRHKRIVRGLFFGGLLIAALFTLLPQRLIGHWLWHALLA